ncbi:DinB family protein [Brevibacillus laterosporus]|uniref:DinB family protein n=1 Tax=Brevibacillus laterosporus TaxID=1465 RepID=UPI000CE35DBF|nr:DinB family protein [Brevibacillus laterosporus]MED1664818.1 DinB family protein [Brevibacillus laterosporus]MED1669145.1 DinB family protein [Brevibacillus laterosporus]MED1717571.1 DinB family protein [Brevibacillus laterosporus]PPA83545.1 hypothetical protein C4A76_19355 [Brevibacillus laterosporus]
MNRKETLQRFEELTKTYLDELEKMDLQELTQKPADDEWSLGQMYLHLIHSALTMQLQNIKVCHEQQEGAVLVSGEKTEAGIQVFAQGSFPPIKIHVPPTKQYTPPQPTTKEELVLGLKNVLDRMRKWGEVIEEIPSHLKMLHPALGALNAQEWYALVEMHYRHHLLQKERLQAFLSQMKQ